MMRSQEERRALQILGRADKRDLGVEASRPIEKATASASMEGSMDIRTRGALTVGDSLKNRVRAGRRTRRVLEGRS
jgi:hypothetical protein